MTRARGHLSSLRRAVGRRRALRHGIGRAHWPGAELWRVCVNRPGMTLIELVVALTITALTLGAGYGALTSIMDHRERATEFTDRALRGAGVRRTLRSWLAGARLTAGQAGPTFRGVDGISRNLPDDELAFLTTARTTNGRGETLVRLYIDRDDETPERGLSAALIEWRGNRTERVELESRAAGLELRYLYGISGERRWLPSWISSTVLPAGVELTLIAAEGDSLPPLLRLPMLVAFEAGR